MRIAFSYYLENPEESGLIVQDVSDIDTFLKDQITGLIELEKDDLEKLESKNGNDLLEEISDLLLMYENGVFHLLDISDLSKSHFTSIEGK